MPRSKSKECCVTPSDDLSQESYKVDAIVSLDERGQMVLPKEIRAKLGVRPGDKLAVVTMERNGKVCCLHLFKADELSGEARNLVRSSSPQGAGINDAGAKGRA